MALEKKIIANALNDFTLEKFIEGELKKAGISTISIRRTPIATRITLTVRRPGVVVGKKGSSIKKLCDDISEKFGIDNPQIDVVEVSNQNLDAKIMAEKIGRYIEIKGNPKRIIRFALNDIMNAGARGAEILIGGKLVGKGGKARTLRARAGYMKKTGNYVKNVRIAKYSALTKGGIIGVTVKIVPPGVLFSDNLDLSSLEGEVVPKGSETIKEIAEEAKEEEKKIEGAVGEIAKKIEKEEKSEGAVKEIAEKVEEEKKKKEVEKIAKKLEENAEVEEVLGEVKKAEKLESAGKQTNKGKNKKVKKIKTKGAKA